MKHLDETQLGALLDGALEDRARADADRHLAECVTCREAFAELETQDRALARALEHDPGDAYFESFASRVQERIRTEGVAIDRVALDEEDIPAPVYAARPVPPVSLIERITRWFSGPRLAWAGGAAAVIVGAGLVFQISNEKPTRTLQNRALLERSQQQVGLDAPPQATSPAPPQETRANASPDDRSSQVRNLRSAAPAEPQATRRADARPEAERTGISHLEEITQPVTPPPTQAPAPSTMAAPPIAATAPPSAAKASGSAVSGRSREVRRVNGEDVPVRGQSLGEQGAKPVTGFAPAPDAAGSRVKRAKEAAKQIAGGPLDTRAKARDEAARPEASTYAYEGANAVQVCGTVRNSAGNPIPGARVAFADLGASTSTDPTGRWCLDVAPGEHSMTVMAVGFREVRRSFRVATGTGDQDFTLAAVPVLEGSVAASPWPPAAQAFAAAAEYATREAEAKKTAGAFDNAATHWQQVADVVKLGPVSVTARRYLADARYRAWQLEPSRARSVAAISALASYLAVVPAGSEKEKTQRRLDQVRR